MIFNSKSTSDIRVKKLKAYIQEITLIKLC